jgi:hypothetical protein
VHLDVEEIVKETDSAFLLRLDDGEEVWIPKSQVSDPESYAQGDCNATVSVTEWIAKQKGLA